MAGPIKKRAPEPEKPQPPPKRICLITCGATAPFPKLVEDVLTPTFLSKLRSTNYTDLWIQYGTLPVERYNELVSRLGAGDRRGITIEGFAYGRGAAWRTVIRAVKGTQIDCRYDQWKEVQQLGDGIIRAEGVMISHAGMSYDCLPSGDVNAKGVTGTGTILDALAIMCPIVVVANPDLMDNHQEELAETMAGFEYLVHGRLGHLEEAIDEAKVLADRRRKNPNVNTGEPEKPVVAAAGKSEEKGKSGEEEAARAKDYANYEVPWTE